MNILTNKIINNQGLSFQAQRFDLKLFTNGKLTLSTSSHKLRRFLKILHSIKFEEGDIKAYLKVNYGKHLDVYNKYSEFYNDGLYDNEEEFWLAFNSFTEK